MNDAQESDAGSVEPIRLAILGLGVAGRSALAAAERSTLCRTVAVCDLNRQRSEELASRYGARAYTTLDELCADEEVEAVYLATPTFLHLANALQLAGSHKHLLVEKPVVKDGAEGDALVEIAREFSVTVVAANTRGRDAPIRALARVVDEGAIGRVLHLTNICYTNWVLRPRFAYELVPALGGGVTFRQAPHQIEIARTIINDHVVAVTAVAGRSSAPVNTVGNYSALVEFEHGAAASLVFNGYGYFDTAELTFGLGEGGQQLDHDRSVRMREAKSWSLDKYGDAGVASRSRGPARASSGKAPWSFVGLTLVSGEHGDLRQSEHGVTVYDDKGAHEEDCSQDVGGLEVDFAEFYGALRDRRDPQHDAEWGATTVKICEAIGTSHRERRRIEL